AHHHAVADLERLLHRAGGDVEGLDQERLDEDGQSEGADHHDDRLAQPGTEAAAPTSSPAGLRAPGATTAVVRPLLGLTAAARRPAGRAVAVRPVVAHAVAGR